jgi:non-ribosomal peptide synthase protein (TIGR01720 family)
VVERMRRAGLNADVRTLFVTPTVAALAAEADHEKSLVQERLDLSSQGSEATSAENAKSLAGSIPLTSAMKRFLYDRKSPDPHHWNIVALLEPLEALDYARLEDSVQHLFAQHDSLSLGFRFQNGIWTAGQREDAHSSACSRLDLSALPREEHEAAVERACAELQSTFDLEKGPLFRVAYFDLGFERPHRVLVCAHHLVTDGFSFGVLIDDLTANYREARDASPSRERSGGGVSYGQWSGRLERHSNSGRLREEIPFWKALPWSDCLSLPRDHYRGDEHNTNESAREIAVHLPRQDTAALLDGLPKGIRIEDALIASLAWALADFGNSRTVLIDRISHGREPIDGGKAPSRTVGFLIAYTPLVLTLDLADPPMRHVGNIAAQLRRIPSAGMGFDLLRYGPAAELSAHPRSEVLFNYVGDLENMAPIEPLFRRSSDPHGPSRSPQGCRQHALAVLVSKQNEALDVRFVYSENLHERRTIDRVVTEFRNCLATIVKEARS